MCNSRSSISDNGTQFSQIRLSCYLDENYPSDDYSDEDLSDHCSDNESVDDLEFETQFTQALENEEAAEQFIPSVGQIQSPAVNWINVEKLNDTDL